MLSRNGGYAVRFSKSAKASWYVLVWLKRAWT